MPSVSPDLIVADVALPGDLVDYAAEGMLVVFAGAGVSMGPPAGYPSFDALTEVLTKQSYRSRRTGEAPDAFLGRAESVRRQMGEAARRFFLSHPSAPTPVHDAIVRLFPGPRDVRIVTTNYDELFEKAMPGLSTWSAPALPRGDDFRGIVHVHGRAAEPMSRIVITDQDFGEAYLSEGWARDFILALYQAHPVLFVGYSHSDVVMTYLARGIGSGPYPKFALVAADADGTNWEALGVKQVVYPNPAKNHEALREVLEGWAGYARRSEVDYERVLQGILGKAPADTSESERSELRRALVDRQRVRYVTRHASGLAWVRWMKEEGLLLPETGDADANSAIAAEQITWLVRGMEGDDSAALRAILTETGIGARPDLQQTVARRILFRNDLTGEELTLWGAMLLQPPVDQEHLAPLLEQSVKLDVPEIALAALDEVVRPQVKLRLDYLRSILRDLMGDDEEESERHGEDQVEVYTLADADYIRRMVHQACRWLLGRSDQALEGRLLSMAESHLMRGHDLHRAGGEMWEIGEDTWSYGQEALGLQGGDADVPEDGRDILVRVALSAVAAVRGRSQAAADAVVASWASSGYPLLNRMALFSVREGGSDNEVVGFVADHPEFFRWPSAIDEGRDALEAHFAGASTEVQDRLADTLRKDAAAGNPVARNSGIALGIDFPEDEEQGNGYARSQQNAQLVPDPLSNLTVKAIPDAIAAMEEVLAAEGDVPQHGRAREISDTLIGNSTWALDVADHLASKGAWDSRVWRCLLWAARNAMPGDTWPEPLMVKVSTWPIQDHAADLARLVEGVLHRTDTPTTEAVRAAAHLIEQSLARGSDLAAVIPGIYQLHRYKNDLPGSTLPPAILRAIEAELESDSNARKAAGMRLFDLVEVNPHWVETTLLPRFGPASDPTKPWAAELWEGLLKGDVQNLPPGVQLQLAHHLPGQLTSLPTGHNRGFGFGPSTECNRVADNLSVEEQKAVGLAVEAATVSSSDPFDEWLGPFVREASEGIRVWWTERVGGKMRQAPALAERIWAVWGRDYLERRIAGYPDPLSPCEVRHLITWVATLPEAMFDDAVALLEQAPSPIDVRGDFVRRLHDTGLPKSNPDAAARLLAFALSPITAPYYWDDHLRRSAQEIAAKAPPSMPALADALLLAGLASADDIDAWTATTI